jgi:hypothetical protein
MLVFASVARTAYFGALRAQTVLGTAPAESSRGGWRVGDLTLAGRI